MHTHAKGDDWCRPKCPVWEEASHGEQMALWRVTQDNLEFGDVWMKEHGSLEERIAWQTWRVQHPNRIPRRLR